MGRVFLPPFFFSLVFVVVCHYFFFLFGWGSFGRDGMGLCRLAGEIGVGEGAGSLLRKGCSSYVWTRLVRGKNDLVICVWWRSRQEDLVAWGGWVRPMVLVQ